MRRTLSDAGLPALLESVAEFEIDRHLQDGVLRDIPMVSWVVSLARAGIAARDYFFVKKLLRFLKDLGDVPVEEREALIRRLEADDAFGKHAGERIVALLDRLDDAEKAALAAKAFRAYLNECVTGRQLRRLLYAIDRLLVADLDVLRAYTTGVPEDKPGSEDPAIQTFVSAGLLYVQSGYGVGGVHPTETLGLFLEHVLELRPDGIEQRSAP